MTFLREHGWLIAAIIGTGLIVTAGNLENPPSWLGLIGWFALLLTLNLYVFLIPNENVYKGSFFLSELALLFGLSLAPYGTRLLFQLIFKPSLDNLLDFIFTKIFLLTAIVYFASACIAYGIKLEKTHEEIEKHRGNHEELERLRQWRLEQILKDAEEIDRRQYGQ